MTSPYWLYDGLAVYRLGHGEPVLLMPAPHRFERPGLREFDALADGLQRLGRQVITYDPPGWSRPLHRGTRSVLGCGGPVPVPGHGGDAASTRLRWPTPGELTVSPTKLGV